MQERDVIREVREKFEDFIADQLIEKRDVAKGELAADFIAKERKLVSRMAEYFSLEALKRWAEEILKRSVATRMAPQQIVLPLDLAGIELPVCFSFRSMTNQIRYVQAAKAEEWQIVSHLKIQRENLEAAAKCLSDTERMYDALRYIFRRFPGITLGEALRMLADEDAGAA